MKLFDKLFKKEEEKKSGYYLTKGEYERLDMYLDDIWTEVRYTELILKNLKADIERNNMSAIELRQQHLNDHVVVAKVKIEKALDILLELKI